MSKRNLKWKNEKFKDKSAFCIKKRVKNVNKAIRIYPVPSIRVSIRKNVQNSKNLLVKNDCAKSENIKRKQSQPTERKLVKIVKNVTENLFKPEIKAVVSTAVKAIVNPVKITIKHVENAVKTVKTFKAVKIDVSNTVVIVTSSIRNIVVIYVVIFVTFVTSVIKVAVKVAARVVVVAVVRVVVIAVVRVVV